MNRPLATIAVLLAVTAAAKAAPPNVVVILTDDQGYADLSFNPHHPVEVHTPHMDALAREGLFFSQGYISGQVCSPTRAGLMLGRYQQRVGVYTAGDGGRGFDPRIPIFPAFLPRPYRSTAIGKWHLGLDNDFPQLKWHALNRGFSECYKFMGRGAHDYFKLKGASGADDSHPLYRNKKRIDDRGYLTTRLTEEAVAFIGRNTKRPFFLYLAYNAVHSPKQAPAADVARYRKKYPAITADRAILMAMLEHLDRGVGNVVGKLKDEGLFENTLLFFLTDNGGSKAMQADNSPLRGFKGSLYEGGLRTPFVVSWPARFPGGRTIDTPVISLDILPTVMDAVAAKSTVGAKTRFDGKSLLPLIEGKARVHHPTLYWSEGGLTGEWAIRHGDWKLHADKTRRELFHLGRDPGEKSNLADEQPARLKELAGLYDRWLDQMAEPIGESSKRWDPSRPTLSKRERVRLKKRQDRKKKRAAEKKKRKPKTATRD